MGVDTAIGWTDHTFNPWWGCTRVSPGCEHCYAEAFAKRTGNDVWGKHTGRRFFSDAHWAEPLKWNLKAFEACRNARVFCASMADVFEDRDELVEHRVRLFELIRITPWLRWQLLTKRPENVNRMWDEAKPVGWTGRMPINIWVGCTVEDQRRADERIPHLLDIDAKVRFLSCEPLLGPLDLSRWLGLEWMDALRAPGEPMSFRGEGGWGIELGEAIRRSHPAPTPAIGWVIVGGESGNSHRPLQSDHAIDLVDQIVTAEIPLFFKQWGGRIPTAGGDRINGRQYKQFPFEPRT